MNKKKLGLTIASTALLATALVSASNKTLASYLNISFKPEPVEQKVCEPNIDSLKQVIADDTFVWNDSTYTQFKDLVSDTVFGGYSKEDKNYNQFHVLQKNGKDISQELDSLGRHYFAELLDQRVGHGGSLHQLFDNLQSYNDLYREMAQKYGVERRLLLAVGMTESRFLPYAISHANCLGLNQLHPSVYKEKNPFDIKENVETSAQLLANHLRYYNGNDTLALTAYNRGRGGLNAVISKANEAGVTSAKDILQFQENNRYLLSKEARAYAQKTLMYKELIRQYQPHEGEQRFLARLSNLQKELEESKLMTEDS